MGSDLLRSVKAMPFVDLKNIILFIISYAHEMSERGKINKNVTYN